MSSHFFQHLPTLADVEAARRLRRTPIGKGASRLEDRTAEDRANEKRDEAFRREVYRLDKGICRCCGRKVQRKLDRVADRAEVHHVHGRVGALRWLVKAALLLCATCHEKVTGKVNERLRIVGSAFFRLRVKGIRSGPLINARAAVTFRKVA